jgi:hypothetical protein
MPRGEKARKKDHVFAVKPGPNVLEKETSFLVVENTIRRAHDEKRYSLCMILPILAGLAADFFAGAFLCNAIPHLVSGLRGDAFPTPFAQPPGRGLSSPIVNFAWGFLNFVIALALLSIARIQIGLYTPLILFLLGFLLLGLMLAHHFGKFRAGR